MNQPMLALGTDGVDVAACGYVAVRAAFRRLLELCVSKLARADLQRAADLLDCDIEPGLGDDIFDMAMDTALYSRPGEPLRRRRARRAIDRIAAKLPVQRDPLMALLASRLRAAFYSVFEIESIAEDGTIAAKDALDGFRPLTIMDRSMAATAEPGTLLAGRFLDAGPWHIGFGIVHTLSKSEAVAICLALSHGGALSDKRDDLHELVYACRIHDDDLMLAAITPMITAMALAIDESDGDLASLFASLAGAVPPPE
jgi:hypothetical protein